MGGAAPLSPLPLLGLWAQAEFKGDGATYLVKSYLYEVTDLQLKMFWITQRPSSKKKLV